MAELNQTAASGNTGESLPRTLNDVDVAAIVAALRTVHSDDASMAHQLAGELTELLAAVEGYLLSGGRGDPEGERLADAIDSASALLADWEGMQSEAVPCGTRDLTCRDCYGAGACEHAASAGRVAA
jgi:hypothetical protein